MHDVFQLKQKIQYKSATQEKQNSLVAVCYIKMPEILNEFPILPQPFPKFNNPIFIPLTTVNFANLFKWSTYYL